ncbi:MAG: hypothetical protein IPK16_10035 [Anaerolineales bacterium]|nr:hypothetical protein [Anaerolineales bacterium]
MTSFVFGRTGVNTIVGKIRDLAVHNRAVILLYFGQLTLQQKREIGRAVHENELAVAI